jgi:hypothetical protein
MLIRAREAEIGAQPCETYTPSKTWLSNQHFLDKKLEIFATVIDKSPFLCVSKILANLPGYLTRAK